VRWDTAATVRPPFEALPRITEGGQQAVRREALRVNDRYLLEFIESYAFCPFSREGRRQGQTSRYVYYADTIDLDPLVDLMLEIAADPKQVVAQVILPVVDVGPDDWIEFCFRLTELGHKRLGGRDVLAVAALHPELSYRTCNPYALIPLFRRAPDATIQWVRLDGLETLYKGREKGSTFVDTKDIPTLLAGPPPPMPLYDRVAETNQSMAKRLSLDKIESVLSEIRTDARRSYERILVDAICDDESPLDEA